MRLLPAVLLALVTCCTASSQTYTISPFAGGGPVNVAGTSVSLSFPSSVAVDATGNVFFVEANQNTVLRWDAKTGVITQAAGYGTAGWADVSTLTGIGDGGAATSAQLDEPAGVAVDSAGNLYIADSINNRIRKVSNGVITTVAGSGPYANAYAGACTILGSGEFNGDGGPATSAQLCSPYGVAVDSAGNLYIADSGSGRIRKVSNGVITTVAGNGTSGSGGDGGPATSAELSSPMGVAVDSSGNLYIVDAGNGRIREVSNGLITTIAGGGTSTGNGPATSASLSPSGVAVDSAGNVYIADAGHELIREVSNGVITTVAGNGGSGSFGGDNGPATSATLYSPRGVAVDSAGNMYIADNGNGRIRKVSNGVITTVAGGGTSLGDNGPAANAALNLYPGNEPIVAMAVDSAGDLYISDANNYRVRKVSNGAITTVAGNGTDGSPCQSHGGPASVALGGVNGLAMDSAGNLYLSVDACILKVSNGTITTVAGNGTSGFSGDGGPATSAALTASGIAVDSAGSIYFADGSSRIRKVTNGVITTVAGNGTLGFSGDGGAATSAQLHQPQAVAVDSAGNIYITETAGSNRVREVSSGVITTVAGSGPAGECSAPLLFPLGDNGPATSAQFCNPSAVAVDSAGNLYVADTTNALIRKVSNGVISTIAGTTYQGFGGFNGFGGDNGPATSALLFTPSGVTVDSSGRIYIADTGNNRIRLLTPSAGTSATPGIGSLSPTSATAGAAALTLTIGGTGFISGDIVTWSTTSQTPLATAYQSPTTLLAMVPASLLANAGTVQVTVVTPTGVPSNASPFTINPAAAGPAITLVSPSSAPAGSPTATVTITGTGFAGGSVAQWNGLSLVTSYVNSTMLTAQIPAGDLINQGTGQITVANTTGPASNSFSFIISSKLNSSLQFLTVAPCRIMDTRNPNGPLGGPFIAGGMTRTIPIPSSACGVPANASAYSLNFTVVPRTGALAYLSVWPTGQTQPLVSTLNSLDGAVIANAAIVPAGTAGAINAYADDDTDLVVDINGYFVPPAASTLQFYPLTPCRVLDTRNPTGTFGGPSIAGGTSRSFPIPSTSCGVPSGAAAYALNVTVVPQGALSYLTAWPTGQTQPFVSTLNSFDGTILANAAIVPAGAAGAASFYATNTTDLVVDINGYFALQGSGGLNFYTATPCRLVDTRNPTGTFGGPAIGAGITRAFPLSQGPCGLPGTPAAQAYSLNMTVVPQGALGYLSTWPAGETQPVVSTLNADDGQIVANAAIVPAGGSGSIDVFVTNATDVVIDTNGYFGP